MFYSEHMLRAKKSLGEGFFSREALKSVTLSKCPKEAQGYDMHAIYLVHVGWVMSFAYIKSVAFSCSIIDFEAT